MHDAPSYQSFLLRLWLEEAPQAQAGRTGWQAQIESIQSGDSWRFADVASLIAFIEEVFAPEEHDDTGLKN